MAEPAGEVVDVSVGHRKALLDAAAKIYLNHMCSRLDLHKSDLPNLEELKHEINLEPVLQAIVTSVPAVERMMSTAMRKRDERVSLEQTIAQFDETGEAATEKVLVVERQKEAKRLKLLNRTLAT